MKILKTIFWKGYVAVIFIEDKETYIHYINPYDIVGESEIPEDVLDILEEEAEKFLSYAKHSINNKYVPKTSRKLRPTLDSGRKSKISNRRE